MKRNQQNLQLFSATKAECCRGRRLAFTKVQARATKLACPLAQKRAVSDLPKHARHVGTEKKQHRSNNESSIGDAGRHMETRVFKLKELVENESVILKYIETQRQVADLLTKSLGRVAFERLRDDLTGYLAFNHPGENIHVKAIAMLHKLPTTDT